jgi:hypothetical protein
MDLWGSHSGSGLANPHLHALFFSSYKALSSFSSSLLAANISSSHMCELKVICRYGGACRYQGAYLPIPSRSGNYRSPFRRRFHISSALLNGASKVCHLKFAKCSIFFLCLGCCSVSGIGSRPIPSPVDWSSSSLVSAASRYTWRMHPDSWSHVLTGCRHILKNEPEMVISDVAAIFTLYRLSANTVR